MSERKTYRASAERDGAWWVLRVAEIGSVTQARRLDQAEAMVRDLVHVMTDKAPDSFDVDVHPDLDPETMELVVRASASARRARVQQLEASIAQREAAAALERGGLTVRDIGRVLGLSHQRVAQLLADRTEAAALRQRLEAELTGADDPRTRVYEPATSAR